MEKDNELIVLWTSGLNKIHIVNLIFRISVIIMLLQLFLTKSCTPHEAEGNTYFINGGKHPSDVVAFFVKEDIAYPCPERKDAHKPYINCEPGKFVPDRNTQKQLEKPFYEHRPFQLVI